ncbi:STAS domain-containing protein [Mycolicibacterium litorale]|uniref:Sulfate transporter n=1 Tax=Mycolicibacterium litorale TaxID=758802 RepID=A0AAD1IPJ3_9MYCO|nr:STAS domain-containing protein [Mycolicibacterium litorale]MCV7418442.1 STAS domain-containing protein [Mycolicibacterium litorale]BBY19697.1 sulfate transporter [Mycolicibacterium litorale]
MRADDTGLTFAATVVGDPAVLTIRGTLDSRTYRTLRDRVIKAALESPAAVVVDVTGLDVPAESAWAVFTSARWHVARWPEVPILLVCEHDSGRSAIKRNGIARYVPLYPTVDDALAALSAAEPPRYRHRARADLSAETASLIQSRRLVEQWLTAWSQSAMIPVAKVVATAFIENALQHTESRPSLRLETDGTTVTVAVEDASHAPANVRERVDAVEVTSGLKIVAALCRTWGNAPTSTGKAVWALLGPENRL